MWLVLTCIPSEKTKKCSLSDTNGPLICAYCLSNEYGHGTCLCSRLTAAAKFMPTVLLTLTDCGLEFLPWVFDDLKMNMNFFLLYPTCTSMARTPWSTVDNSPILKSPNYTTQNNMQWTPSMSDGSGFYQNSRLQVNKIVNYFEYQYIPVWEIFFLGGRGFQISNWSEQMPVLMSVSVNRP